MLLPYNILKKYNNTHYVFEHNDLEHLSIYDDLIQPIRKGIRVGIIETKDFPLKGTVISHFKNNESILTITTIIDDVTYVLYAVNSINEFHWLEQNFLFEYYNHEATLEKIILFFKHKIRKEKIKKLL